MNSSKNNQFFGVIVFESKCWPFIRALYTLSDQRWEIEEMFTLLTKILYGTKSKTRVHSRNESFTSTEFINSLVTNNCDKSL